MLGEEGYVKNAGEWTYKAEKKIGEKKTSEGPKVQKGMRRKEEC